MKRRATEARVRGGEPPVPLRNERGTFEAANTATAYDATSSEPSSSFCFGASELPTCLSREFRHLTPVRQQQVGIDVLGLQKPSAPGPADNSSLASTAKMDHEECYEDDDVAMGSHIDEDEFEDITSEMLESLCHHLEQVTVNKPSSSVAYRMAMEREELENLPDDVYVRSKFFRAQFLRAVDYIPKRAATRICKHFTVKLDLFGPDLLHKPITLDHFSPDDMVALESGGFQVLPCNDRAGRPILFGRYTSMRYREKENMLRALWYIWSSIVEDHKHQKSGIIAIGYENGRTPLERFDHHEDESNNAGSDDDQFHLQDGSGGFDRALARGILNIPLALPIRPVAYHICADGDRPQWQDVSDMVLVTLCKFVRLRMRFHHGTSMECNYALLTHGVPTTGLPKLSEEGIIDLTNHRQWVQDRLRIERERKTMLLENRCEPMER